MAVIARGQAVVQLDNSSGTLTALTNGTVGASIEVTQNVGNYFTLDSGWQKSLDGGKSWSVTLRFVADTSSTSAYAYLRDWMLPTSGLSGERTIQIDFPDSAPGSQRYSGEGRIVSLTDLGSAEGGSGDPVMVTAQLRGSGALTDSTIT
jgi:hypothetical protein